MMQKMMLGLVTAMVCPLMATAGGDRCVQSAICAQVNLELSEKGGALLTAYRQQNERALGPLCSQYVHAVSLWRQHGCTTVSSELEAAASEIGSACEPYVSGRAP